MQSADRLRLALSSSLSFAIIAAGLLGGCASSSDQSSDSRVSRPTRKFTSADYGARIVEPGQPVPKGGGTYKLGAPYRMGGKWYVPREEPGYNAAGIASWYGEDFHGRRTANGEIYDMHALTAAHPTLPLPSYAWVTNDSNGRTLLVRINDRGPYARDRVIDLSRAAARELGYEGNGTAQVRVRYAGPAPLDGNEARERRVLAEAPWRRGTLLAEGTPARRPEWNSPRQIPVAAPPQADFSGRDDYAALMARGRNGNGPSPVPASQAQPPRQPEPLRQAVDDSAQAEASGWSVSQYRQGVAGQRRSLGGP